MPRPVHQVRRHDVVQGAEHALDPSGELLVPISEHMADLLALQVFLAAAQGAGDDGEGAVLGPAREVFLGHIGQRADHHVAAIVAHQFGRHAFEFAAKKHVEEEGLQHVVTVVAQRNLGGPQLVRHTVQNAPAQAAAQAAHGLAFGDDTLDDGIGVLILDVKRHAELRQVGGQDVLGETGLLLIQVNGDQIEVNWRTGFEFEQNVQQGITVLAPRHAHHDLVALFDHVEVGNGLPHLAVQALAELVHLEGVALGGLGRLANRFGGSEGVSGFSSVNGLREDLGGDCVVHGAIFADPA